MSDTTEGNAATSEPGSTTQADELAALARAVNVARLVAPSDATQPAAIRARQLAQRFEILRRESAEHEAVAA